MSSAFPSLVASWAWRMTSNINTHRRRPRFRIYHLLAAIGCAAIALSFGTVLWPFTNVDYFVCDGCGHIKRSKINEIPFTHCTFYKVESLIATPMSNLLHRQGLVERCDHRWHYFHGSGFSKFGVGKQSARDLAAIVRIEAYSEGLEMLLAHLSACDKSKSVRAILGMKSATRVYEALMDAELPMGSSARVQDIEKWVVDHRELLHNLDLENDKP